MKKLFEKYMRIQFDRNIRKINVVVNLITMRIIWMLHNDLSKF